MRRQFAAATSLSLHAAIVAGAALIIFPLKVEKVRRDGVQLELEEAPGPSAQRPAPRRENAAAPLRNTANPPVTQAEPATEAQPPATPSTATPTSAAPAPERIADNVTAVPTPVLAAPSYLPPRASAIAAVNPPLLGERFREVTHTTLLPHALPTDPLVPALNPAQAEANQPATPVASAPRNLTAAPQNIGSAGPVAAAKGEPPSAPKAPVRLDPTELATQLRRSAPTPQTRGFDRAALGSAVQGARPVGAGRLSMRQKIDLVSLIRRQITPCWNPPSMAENPGVVVVSLRIRLEPSGAVSGTPSVSSIDGANAFNQAYVTALSGSVRRAVLRCAPLKLPADLYDAWSDVELNFDPRDVL